MEMIRTKVAAIINAQDLALAAGSAHGVEIGMKFAVLDPKARDIPSPDDPGLILGSIDVAKTLVKVVAVENNISVARTFRTVRGGGLAALLQVTGSPDRRETLLSDAQRLAQELDPKDSYIGIGDEALQYEDEWPGVVYEPA